MSLANFLAGSDELILCCVSKGTEQEHRSSIRLCCAAGESCARLLQISLAQELTNCESDTILRGDTACTRMIGEYLQYPGDLEMRCRPLIERLAGMKSTLELDPKRTTEKKILKSRRTLLKFLDKLFPVLWGYLRICPGHLRFIGQMIANTVQNWDSRVSAASVVFSIFGLRWWNTLFCNSKIVGEDLNNAGLRRSKNLSMVSRIVQWIANQTFPDLEMYQFLRDKVAQEMEIGLTCVRCILDFPVDDCIPKSRFSLDRSNEILSKFFRKQKLSEITRGQLEPLLPKKLSTSLSEMPAKPPVLMERSRSVRFAEKEEASESSDLSEDFDVEFEVDDSESESFSDFSNCSPLQSPRPDGSPRRSPRITPRGTEVRKDRLNQH